MRQWIADTFREAAKQRGKCAESVIPVGWVGVVHDMNIVDC